LTWGPVQVLVSELGLDFSKWRDAKHFASYLGKCPDLKISNSKVLGKATRRVNCRAARVFSLSARSAGKTQTCLGVFYRRLKSRIGAPKALAALAHKLAVIFYSMVTTGKEFKDIGADYYDRLNRLSALNSLRRRARDLGMELVPALG
jgi:transposase